MKIYLDLLFLLNFAFDFLLLLGVSILLRRCASINRILIGAFIGGLSILSLFTKMNSIELFLFKIFISFLMILISFGYRDIKYTFRNLLYLYTSSIILGGFLYFLNVQFSYKKEGIVFYHNGLSVNYIILLITAPIIIYIYIKQGLKLKNTYSKYYKIELFFNQKHSIKLTAFLDTGNTLEDPYFKKPVLLVNKKKIIYDINEFKMILVPYRTIDGSGIIKCIQIPKIKIENIGIRYNFLVGFIDEGQIHIDGIDCILNEKILEACHV